MFQVPVEVPQINSGIPVQGVLGATTTMSTEVPQPASLQTTDIPSQAFTVSPAFSGAAHQSVTSVGFFSTSFKPLYHV